MATTLLLRSGTTLQASLFTGGEGELFYDYETHRLYIHDGVNQGGYEVHTEDNIGLENLGIVDGSDGQVLRTDGNGNYTFETITSISATEPYQPKTGDFWYDSNTGVLKLRYASSWIGVSAGSVDLDPYYTGVQTDAAISAAISAAVPTSVLTALYDAISEGEISSPTTTTAQINSALTNYYTKSEVDSAILNIDLGGSYYTKSETDAAISASVSTSISSVLADGTFIDEALTLPVLTAEPAAPVNGMIAIADGTSWNPTATGVQTAVVYLAGSWKTMAS